MDHEAKTPKELIQNLAEFLSYLEKVAPLSVNQKLEDIGYDPKAIAERGEMLARSILDKQVQEEREILHKARIKAQSKIKSQHKNPNLTLDEVNRLIAELQAGKHGIQAQQQAIAHFKDFNNVTMEDKISLLQDIEFLKSMTEDDIENK